MTLRLRTDCDPEALAAAAIGRLSERPPHPLARTVLLAPSLGVGRWLQQGVARRLGIAASIEPMLPGAFVWQAIARSVPGLPERSPFEAARARWRLLAILDGAALGEDVSGASRAAEAAPAEAAALLARWRAASPRSRVGVASRLGSTFERYLTWRRDWLAAWERGRQAIDGGPRERWQAWLWRRLVAQVPEAARRVHPFDAMAEALRDPVAVAASLDVARVVAFGTLPVAPDALRLLAGLGAAIDVDVFALDPCREFWEDRLDPRRHAQLRLAYPDLDWLYEGQPAVLGQWGAAVRDHVALIHAAAEAGAAMVDEAFRERAAARADGGCLPATTRLNALQQCLFEASDTPLRDAALVEPDASIAIHASHGPLRQAEVLHDALVDAFEAMPDLRPSDVVVLCADLERAAPALRAVFDAAPPERRIPLRVDGIAAGASPAAAAVLGLLDLAIDGVTLSRLVAWWQGPGVDEAMAVDPALAARWGALLAQAGAVRGLDGPHGLREALARLLLGAAGGPQETVQADGRAAVAGLRLTDAASFDALVRQVEAIEALAAEPEAALPLAARIAALEAALHACFAGRAPFEGELAEVHAALASLLEEVRETATEASARLDLAGLADLLREALGARVPAVTPSGPVIACPFGALRGVPFRVVAMLGLDEGVFPAGPAVDEFDLMRSARRAGDRSPGDDDRAAFLEALTAARDRVLVVHCGADPRDGGERAPALPVVQLCDWLRAVRPADGLRGVCRREPLLPFAAAAFASGPAGRASPAIEWLAAARASAASLATRSAAPDALSLDGFAAAPLAAPGESAVELERLERWLAGTAERVVRERLDFVVDRLDPPMPELPPRETAARKREHLERLLADPTVLADPALLDWLAARPDFPAGDDGREAANDVVEAALLRLAPLAACGLGGRPLSGRPRLEAALASGDVVAGRGGPWWSGRDDDGTGVLVQGLVTDAPLGARLALRAALSHALAQAAPPDDARFVGTWLIAADRQWWWPAGGDPAVARARLEAVCTAVRRLGQGPVGWRPRAWWQAWAGLSGKAPSPEPAAVAARMAAVRRRPAGDAPERAELRAIAAIERDREVDRAVLEAWAAFAREALEPLFVDARRRSAADLSAPWREPA